MRTNHTKQRTLTCLILPATLRMARPMCHQQNLLHLVGSKNRKMPELAFYGSLATSYASRMSDRDGDEAPVVPLEARWKLELRCALCSIDFRAFIDRRSQKFAPHLALLVLLALLALRMGNLRDSFGMFMYVSVSCASGVWPRADRS